MTAFYFWLCVNLHQAIAANIGKDEALHALSTRTVPVELILGVGVKAVDADRSVCLALADCNFDKMTNAIICGYSLPY